MATRRLNERRSTWAWMAVLLGGTLSAAACGAEDGGGSRGANGGLNQGEGGEGGAEGGDPSDEGGIAVDFDVCVEGDCGPALGMPNWTCADGSLAGPTGACVPTADGSCGWEVATCSDDGGGDDPSGGGGDDPSGGGSDDPNGGGGDDPSGGGGDDPNGGGPGDDGSCACPEPAPGMPNWICEDGTVGGPSCEPDAAGVCGWQIRDCDPAGGTGGCESCPDPAPGMPNELCADGTVGGPSCEPDEAGVCGWIIRECPADDGNDDGDGGAEFCESCPDPAPGMPNELCADGTIGGPACLVDADGACRWHILECP